MVRIRKKINLRTPRTIYILQIRQGPLEVYFYLPKGGANASEEKPKDAYFIFFKNLLRRKTFPINFRSKKNLSLYILEVNM